MAESACTGDESAARNVERQRFGASGGVDLLRESIGPREPQEALDPSQLRVFLATLDGRHAVVGDATTDLVEGGVVVEVPAECDDVLGGSTLQQDAAFVGVQTEADRVGRHVVEVHADGVATEAFPVTELVRFDDDIAEVLRPRSA